MPALARAFTFGRLRFGYDDRISPAQRGFCIIGGRFGAPTKKAPLPGSDA